MKHHADLLESLEVWLHDMRLWFKDVEHDNGGFYFIVDNERVQVPEKLQEICHTIYRKD